MNVVPVVLEGDLIRLEPLTMGHLVALCDVGFDEDIWRMGMNRIATKEDMRKYISIALEDEQKKVSLPFATVAKTTNNVIGSTRFGNIDVSNRKVEIGWTWIGKQWQRTGVNTEAKFLMLRHAFEVWNCIRVEFKTDVLNERSRNAIKRIGAKEEGILRNHVITSTGRFRDSVYYSILDVEWENVRQHFTKNLLRT